MQPAPAAEKSGWVKSALSSLLSSLLYSRLRLQMRLCSHDELDIDPADGLACRRCPAFWIYEPESGVYISPDVLKADYDGGRL